MHPVVANSLAFLVGVFLSVTTIGVVQSVGHKVYPSPSALTPLLIHQLPLGAFLFVEASYVAGSIVGGFFAAKLAASHKLQLAVAVGVLLTVFGLQNLVMIPHPMWFAVLSSCSFLPAAYCGAVLAGVEGESVI